MGISPEKYAIITFLGQDPVSCKITVGSKCLTHVKNFNTLLVKFPMKMKMMYILKKKKPGKI